MFSNGKDEYTEATEHASINTHNVVKNRGYKLGIFNLLLLTTIGLMGYVGFDSLQERSTFLKNINILNQDKTTPTTTKTDKELLELLGTVEEENRPVSVTSAINSIVNNSYTEENSLYRQALSREIHGE